MPEFQYLKPFMGHSHGFYDPLRIEVLEMKEKKKNAGTNISSYPIISYTILESRSIISDFSNKSFQGFSKFCMTKQQLFF